jgi:hypothetical protein
MGVQKPLEKRVCLTHIFTVFDVVLNTLSEKISFWTPCF